MHLDTHAVVWLHTGQLRRFTPAVLDRLRPGGHHVSPAVRLELAYLHEIGRIATSSDVVLDTLRAHGGLDVASEPFDLVALRAVALTWTRDPFDRLIVAQALVAGQPLLTADRTIRAHLDTAVWD